MNSYLQNRPSATRAAYADFEQPSGRKTRSVEAGNLLRAALDLTGRRINSPPQFGHRPLSFSSAQVLQNVHSKEQILASSDSGARSQSQHSQFGFKSSMVPPWTKVG
jgi:hypothetical protein